jgi:hypothetical protein
MTFGGLGLCGGAGDCKSGWAERLHMRGTAYGESQQVTTSSDWNNFEILNVNSFIQNFFLLSHVLNKYQLHFLMYNAFE